jgi:anti-sigma B factor antagonist
VNLKTTNREVDGITIVDCSGRITLGEGSVVLRDAVKELLTKGQKKILLNLGDVNYIDSSGIGELVSAYTTVRNQGGELKLLNLTKKVHDLLQITKLYTVFDVRDDETTAVKAFR